MSYLNLLHFLPFEELKILNWFIQLHLLFPWNPHKQAQYSINRYYYIFQDLQFIIDIEMYIFPLILVLNFKIIKNLYQEQALKLNLLNNYKHKIQKMSFLTHFLQKYYINLLMYTFLKFQKPHYMLLHMIKYYRKYRKYSIHSILKVNYYFLMYYRKL